MRTVKDHSWLFILFTLSIGGNVFFALGGGMPNVQELIAQEVDLAVREVEVAKQLETVQLLSHSLNDTQSDLRQQKQIIESTIEGRNSTWLQGVVVDIKSHPTSYQAAVIEMKEETGEVVSLTVNRGNLDDYLHSLKLMQRIDNNATIKNLIGEEFWYCIEDGWVMSKEDGKLPKRSLAIVVEN